MKFLKKDGENFVFQVGKREKSLITELCQLYPLVPESHHRISSSPDAPNVESNQHLLEEALAEHRRENKNELQAMLRAPGRFQEISTGYRFTLTPAQIEWLLQVLNDIRVGSWLQLGAPDEKQGKRLRLNLQSARHLWAMELAGHLQFILLSARDSASNS